MRYLFLVVSFLFITSCTYTGGNYQPSHRIRMYDSSHHYIGYQVITKYKTRYYDVNDHFIGYSK